MAEPLAYLTQRQVSDKVEAFVQAQKPGAKLQAEYRRRGFYWSPKGRPPKLYVWRRLADGEFGWRQASIGG